MELEHKRVISNLSNVNDQYSQQVSENEMLKTQLSLMQQQHSEMINRFD